MVKLEVFAKGLFYYTAGFVSLDCYSEKSIHMVVNVKEATDGDTEKLVSFRHNGEGWVTSCTCKFGSNTGEAYGLLCSHIIASIIYLDKKSKLVWDMISESKQLLPLCIYRSKNMVKLNINGETTLFSNPNAKGWQIECTCSKGLCPHKVAGIRYLTSSKNYQFREKPLPRIYEDAELQEAFEEMASAGIADIIKKEVNGG